MPWLLQATPTSTYCVHLMWLAARPPPASCFLSFAIHCLAVYVFLFSLFACQVYSFISISLLKVLEPFVRCGHSASFLCLSVHLSVPLSVPLPVSPVRSSTRFPVRSPPPGRVVHGSPPQEHLRVFPAPPADARAPADADQDCDGAEIFPVSRIRNWRSSGRATKERPAKLLRRKASGGFL